MSFVCPKGRFAETACPKDTLDGSWPTGGRSFLKLPFNSEGGGVCFCVCVAFPINHCVLLCFMQELSQQEASALNNYCELSVSFLPLYSILIIIFILHYFAFYFKLKSLFNHILFTKLMSLNQ